MSDNRDNPRQRAVDGVAAFATIYTKRHKRLIEAIIAERKKAGIRQVELAKQLKHSQTWIARIESGKRRIDVVEFLDLAEAIDFNAPKLLEQLFKV
jgi:transcriptional regulator with XRE-family HTH domain